MRSLRRPAVTAASLLGALAAVVAVAPVAGAHAIIELNGAPAYAGRTSLMTLEVQHGCLTNQDGVVQVMAFVGKPWGAVRPQPVEGWTSTRQRAGSGQQITWTKQGPPQVFNEPVYLPIRVTWPQSPGVYGMTVTQVCPSDTTTWNTADAPATADAPSPPLTPLPQVQVLATVKPHR